MPRRPNDPSACIYYEYHRATWGYDGGEAEEHICTHPEGDGECDPESDVCPYYRAGEEPMTQEEAYEAACEAEFDRRREECL